MSDERLAELRASAEQWEVLTIRESRELLAEVEALRAEASLGAALRAVLREKRQFFGLVGPLAIGRDGAVCILHPDGTCSETDATRALQSLLSALPVVEDAPDHREEDHMADDDEFPPRYSGDNSKDFWDRVNALPKAHWAEAYSLGVALQNLEGQVLRALTKHKRRRARAGEER